MCGVYQRAGGLVSSFCTNLSECGVSIKNLQTLMGHQSISTTALYINENPTTYF